ncbi:MAG: outer membrane protein assembly factor BamD [Candidatus Rokubacteria bacterium]|nr:outer membrane protein assembly factor BamD [Candidatus Rokubacteria bacterium]
MLGQESARALPRQAPLSPTESARRSALFLALVFLLGGCAGVAEVTGTATQQDVFQLRADLTALQTATQRARADADALSTQLDRRLRELQAESERQTTALGRRLDSLTTTLTALTARLDELGTRVETLTRDLRSAAPPKPAPSTAVPARPAPAPPTASLPPTPAPGGAPPPTSRPATDSLRPQDLYQAAYIDFSKGSYALAIDGFREFLRRFPEHALADNAQYWIGEAHLSLARGYANAGDSERATQSLEQAVQELKKVIANYPRGDKAPAALYKEALALLELGQPALAKARLEYLVENFPQAAETPLARERLASLRER